MSKLPYLASLLLLSAMLTACGGGGGSSSASVQPETTPPAVSDPSSDPAVDLPGRVAVAWSAPTQREDGSTLPASDIAGYEVYHLETASGEMDIIEVEGNVTEYQLPLAAGTHELGLSVVDVNGVRSALTEMQTVQIN